MNPLDHFLKFGKVKKRSTGADQLNRYDSQKFSRSQESKSEEMDKSDINLSSKLQQLSSEEKYVVDLLKQHDFFDSAWYVAQNKDVQRSGEDPWVHFVRYGMNENRRPNPFFDPVWYLKFYRDVFDSGGNPLLHYLTTGLREGRKSYATENINILAVEHCTNACQYCSTSSPYARRISHPASSFFPGLDLLETEGIPFKYIAITGGEPFLHPDIGAFIHELRERYPSKLVGATTNFYWANQNTIRLYAPAVQLMNGGLGISLYENIITKLGGLDRVNSLIRLLRNLCPETTLIVENRPDFDSWELHMDKREVKDTCITSDCFILRADGKISHCSIGAGLENIPEYMPVMNLSKERLFDLSKGIDGFSSWAAKYPFDLCSHCTMWRKISTPWCMSREIRQNASETSIPIA